MPEQGIQCPPCERLMLFVLLSTCINIYFYMNE